MFKHFSPSIRMKILLGYVFIIACLGIFLLVVSGRMNQLQQENDFIVHHDLQVHNLTSALEKHILDMETGQRGFVITRNESYLAPYMDARTVWQQDFEALNDLVRDNPAQQRRLETIQSRLQRWIEIAGEPLIAAGRSGDQAKIDEFFAADPGKVEVDGLRSLLDTFRNTELQLTEARISNLEQSTRSILLVMYITWAVILILTLTAAVMVSRNISKTIRQVTATIRAMAGSGDLTTRVKVNSRDEVGELAQAANRLLDRAEDQNRAKELVAQLATEMQNPANVEALARLFLRRLAYELNIPYGVVYLVKEDVLERAAAYAAGEEQEITDWKNRIELGRGLVGQCAAEQRLIRLDSVPPDYIRISSGLGQAAPSQIVIVPAVFEGKTTAVVEIASFEPVEEEKMDLLKEFTALFGTSVHSAVVNMVLQQLYSESQVMNEELQAQSEELQMQTEELQAQTEEMQMQTEELRMQAEEMQILNEKLEQQKKIAEETASELETYAKKLETTSNYKSEFLANMSHELRTPLNSMLILSEILAENRNHTLTEEERRYAEVIHSSGKDLLALINDILDLSKVEAGEMLVEMGAVNLSELPDIMNRYFLKTAEQKGIDFRIQLDALLPGHFYTDEMRLQQILRNLLSNAFKFTKQGEVSLTISRSLPPSTGLAAGKDYLAFSVADTGIGIPEEKLELIFDAFKQVDGATARQYGGTGLGLSISLSLARLLDGDISVESVEGKGSRFTLYLPCITEPPTDEKMLFLEAEAAPALDAVPRWTENAAQSIEAEERPDDWMTPLEESLFQGRKVLVVDDDIRNVYALVNGLEKLGMETFSASNGSECLEMLMEHPDTDIILLDIMMPEMDGYETLAAIRGELQLKDMPVIVLTAKAMKEDRDKCLAAGASDYLSKPLNMKELISRMKLWLGRKLSL
ncbi:CHASE3 domain-containing protein [Paenibacillus terreus]|uniref:histidine kinase n=1 Tax=Paenibacillus terreus TaxID=1387834 RepID=A0ABV5B5Z8_9BACL